METLATTVMKANMVHTVFRGSMFLNNKRKDNLCTLSIHDKKQTLNVSKAAVHGF